MLSLATEKGGIKPMKNKETVSWQDQKASERFAMISPLLADDLDPAKRSQIRSRIAETNSVSERTLYRFEVAWRRDGYSGLRPVNRQMRRSQKLPENFDEIVRQAIQLKKEVPSRSVARIILILEMEGWVSPGVLKRSTLQRYLYKAGLGVKQMRRYTEARNATSRRFCKPHRMMLTQCDIKYGCSTRCRAPALRKHRFYSPEPVFPEEVPPLPPTPEKNGRMEPCEKKKDADCLMCLEK
jgi:transposase